MKNKQPMLIISKHRQSRGFALVEVLIAALVLAVGSAAFLKLQSISLKNSNNNYARTQATMIASSFVEQLRSNRGFFDLPAAARTNSIIGGTVALTAAPQNNNDCQSGANTVACVQATLNYQRYLTSLQMGGAFPQNLSLLCYREDTGSAAVPAVPATGTPGIPAVAAVRGYLRVTYLWRNNLSSTKTAFTAADCPTNFSGSLAATDLNNSVTIYVQL